MKKPTQAELADFRAYCRTLTTSQVHAVYHKEFAARRYSYAHQAELELVRRGEDPDE